MSPLRSHSASQILAMHATVSQKAVGRIRSEEVLLNLVKSKCYCMTQKFVG